MTAGSTITNAGSQPNVIATVDGKAVTTGTAIEIGNYLVTTAEGTLTVTPITINNVDITIDAPEAGQPLAVSASTTTADVTLDNVTWQPEISTAAYATVYTAEIKITADANYGFADDAVITVNGKTANVTKNDDGTLTISYQFPKTELEPVSITDVNQEVSYSPEGITIPAEGMFEIPEGAGAPTYRVIPGTGEGTYEDGKLTVTKCGTLGYQYHDSFDGGLDLWRCAEFAGIYGKIRSGYREIYLLTCLTPGMENICWITAGRS